VPVEPAALKVWQPPQPALAKIALPAACAAAGAVVVGGAEVEALLLPPARDSRPAGQTPRMTVAVIDIGSNTGRLLVARRGNSAAVVALRNERTVLGLGHEIESTGTISAAKLEQTMACARRYAKLARAHGAVHVDLELRGSGFGLLALHRRRAMDSRLVHCYFATFSRFAL